MPGTLASNENFASLSLSRALSNLYTCLLSLRSHLKPVRICRREFLMSDCLLAAAPAPVLYVIGQTAFVLRVNLGCRFSGSRWLNEVPMVGESVNNGSSVVRSYED